MADSQSALASFVPRRIVEALAARASSNPEPHCERYDGALLFTDIAGFVPIAERISGLGPDGVERLSEVLNEYLGHLIRAIHVHGGDVVSFHGDALLAEWPAAAPAELPAAAARAALCALAMHASFGDYAAAEETHFSLKTALGAGEIRAFHVAASRNDRTLFFLAGAALQSLLGALEHSQGHQIVVDERARSLLEPCAELVDQGESTVLKSLDAAAVPRRDEARVERPSSDDGLARYVAPVVRARVAARQEGWLAELRRVSILFVNVRGIDFGTSQALPRVQELVASVQAVLTDLEGSFQQCVVDDKGVVLLAAFGLPPFAHEDDALRAARASLALEEALLDLELDYSIGLTRGRALCGPVGSDERREYAMIGAAVNLSARLMAAAGSGGVLCDGATVQEAGEGAGFEELPAIQVKGRAERVPVFRPGAASWVEDTAVGDQRRPLIGRALEQSALMAHLQRALGGVGSTVSVEGEAGLGKSRLLEALREMGLQSGAAVWRVGGDAVERLTPYFSFRALMAKLLGDDPGLEPTQRAERTVERLPPELQRLAPLLDVVLPFDLPDSDVTSQMVGEVRADNTRRLLVGVIETAQSGPAVLVAEDIHWFDSASLGLLRDLSRSLPGLLIVAGSRPPDGANAPHDDFLKESVADRIALAPLDLDSTAELVADQLGVNSVPREAAERIFEKAGGNPFFTEELALSLKESGALSVSEGRCRWQERSEAPLPDTLQGVVTSRIDRLTPSEQLTTKVASVIGRKFAYGLLSEAHPVAHGDALRQDTATLVRVDLTRVVREEPDPEWIFKHVVTREAAYALLPFAQRRGLHANVARSIEEAHAENLSGVQPLLAYHFLGAKDFARATDCLEAAGEQALRAGTYREAIRFFDQAARLVDEGDVEVELLRRIRWQRHLGDCHLRTGNPGPSRVHLERALRELGRPAPRSRLAIAGEISREVGRQMLHRALPARFVGTGRERARATEEAFAAEHLSQVCFFTDVLEQGIAVILRSLNLAERLGPSAQLARVYALAGTSAGMQGAHGLARFYQRLARGVLPAVESPSDRALIHVYFALQALSVAQWEEVRGLAEEGLAMAERMGDRRRLGDHLCLLVMGGRLAGETDLVRTTLEKLRSGDLVPSDPMLRCWTHVQLAEDALLRGALDEVPALLAAAREPLEECGLSEKIWVVGNEAHAHLRRGALDEALACAREGLATMKRIPPMRLAALEGYAGVVETFIAVAVIRGRDRELLRLARAGLRKLDAFSRGFRFGRARTALLRGRFEAARGREARASSHHRRALAFAREMAMPWEEGQAHLAIGLALPLADAERQAELVAALRLFEGLGAAPYAEIARRALTP